MTRETELRKEIALLRAQLHDRGAELLTVLRGAAHLDEAERVLLCQADHTTFALPLAVVQEVVPAPRLEPLPETPDWIAGVLNLRGKLVPVIDLSVRLAGRPRRLELTDQVVICLDGPWRVGLVVQDVSSILELEPEALQAPSPDLPSAAYVSGTLRQEEGLALLLSLDRLLAGSGIQPEEGR